MTQKLVTPAGVIVEMQQTRFRAVTIEASGGTSTSTNLPMGAVSASLMKAATQDDRLATTASVLRHPEGNLGVLYACAGGGLAVMLFDLGEPQVQAWLEESAARGHVSLVLMTDNAHRLVRLPAEDFHDAFTMSPGSTPASQSAVSDALDALLEQVGDERLAHIWRRQGKRALEHCIINLVMPAIDASVSMTRH